MNASKLADISEIVSSIAIVITLVFLTLQMQQNTQAIEATSRQGALGSDTNFLVQAVNNPETILAWSKPELTDKEAIKLNESLILFFRNRENDFAQYQRGVMDGSTWNRYTSSIRSLFAFERVRNWWSNLSAQYFDPGYVSEVNRILAQSPVYHGQIQHFVMAAFEKPDEYQRIMQSSTSK